LAERVKDDKRFLPALAEPLSVGYDVRACMKNQKAITVRPGQYIKLELGFRAFVPENWWYEIKPRSSTFAKKSLHALYGTIDESFEMELLFAAQYLPDVSSMGKDLTIEYGEAVAQIIPVKRQSMIVEEISNQELEQLYKERPNTRTGGFGSTSA
jgi:dUTPase